MREARPNAKTTTRMAASISAGLLFANSALFPRNRQKRGIELYESVVDSAIGCMAGVASFGAGQCRGFFAGLPESIEGPLAAVLDFGLHGREPGLIMAALIDGTFRFRSADFEDERGFIGPLTGFKEYLIS